MYVRPRVLLGADKLLLQTLIHSSATPLSAIMVGHSCGLDCVSGERRWRLVQYVECASRSMQKEHIRTVPGPLVVFRRAGAMCGGGRNYRIPAMTNRTLNIRTLIMPSVQPLCRVAIRLTVRAAPAKKLNSQPRGRRKLSEPSIDRSPRVRAGTLESSLRPGQ